MKCWVQIRLFYFSLYILYNYVSASCFNMPTEVKQFWYSSDCWDGGFPEQTTCPYEHPFLHQNLRQVVPIAGRGSSTVLCQSTKVCCSNGGGGALPENKERLLEMLQMREDELEDVSVNCDMKTPWIECSNGGVSMVAQQEKKDQIQEIKNILYPSPSPIPIPESKELSSVEVFVLIFWTVCLLLILSWFMMCLCD